MIFDTLQSEIFWPQLQHVQIKKRVAPQSKIAVLARDKYSIEQNKAYFFRIFLTKQGLSETFEYTGKIFNWLKQNHDVAQEFIGNKIHLES